jgi:hypothetical protein
LESALAEITRLLETRGVRPLVLKGAAFAHWLYDDPRERSYGDIDLLVAPDRFQTAMRGLAELNFEARSAFERTKERAAHHEQLTRAGALPVEVEWHHTLRLVLAPRLLVWQRMIEGRHTIEVGGAPVSVPSRSVSAVIVGLHAAQHGDRWLPPLDDLRRALEREDLETWRAASALAWDLGAGPAFAAGLRLDSIGRDVADRLELGDTSPRLTRLLDAVPSNDALSIERFVATPGAGARLKLLASEFAPRADFTSDPATPGRPSGLGVIGAYMRRLLQLMRRLPRAMRAWLRAAVPPLKAEPPPKAVPVRERR